MKMTLLLCACAVVITLETQNCRKRVPCSVEVNFLLIGIDRNGGGGGERSRRSSAYMMKTSVNPR